MLLGAFAEVTAHKACGQEPQDDAGLSDIGVHHLDQGLIEEDLAVHPDFERSGEIAARRDHDFEKVPLADGDGGAAVVDPPAGLSGVRAFSGSQFVGAPDEVERVAGVMKNEAPEGIARRS